LVRGRDDAVVAQRRVRQQLKRALRNDIRYVANSWTGAHRRWLSELKLPEPAQRIVFEEYVDAIVVATARIERLTRAIETEVLTWRFAPVGGRCRRCAHPGCCTLSLWVAELGDLTRFASARQLMGYWACPGKTPPGAPPPGLDHQSGNSYARRALIEAAWAYRHPGG